MDHAQRNQIVNFIWGIADDVLRDYYVRGKYRDVILPMVVIRLLDVLLESSKDAVLKMKETLDKANVVNQDRGTPAGCPAAVLQRVRVHPQEAPQFTAAEETLKELVTEYGNTAPGPRHQVVLEDLQWQGLRQPLPE